MPTMNVKDADGATVAIEKPLAPGRAAAASSRPIALATEDAAAIGATNEAAPADDTEASGLNGRLQRIAQRLTSLIAQLPATLGSKTAANSLSVAPASDAEFAIRSPAPDTDVATIALGASLSGAVDLAAHRLHAIFMPAAWDAASLSFQVSHDGAAYADLQDKEGEFTVAAGAARAIVVDPAVFFGFRYLKIRSGLAGAAVNQTAERQLTLLAVAA